MLPKELPFVIGDESTKRVRFVVMSDTHQFHQLHHIESSLGADVLLHCGDFSLYGGVPTLRKFNEEFLENMKSVFKFIIIIIGNHDNPELERLDYDIERYRKLYLYNATHVLFDSSVCLFDKIKIHGMSWMSRKESSFPYTQYAVNDHPTIMEKLKLEKCQKIASDTNILLTHKPPIDILDDGTGCNVLRNCILGPESNLNSLQLVAFGHVHSKYGAKSIIKDRINSAPQQIWFVNAAVNRSNTPVFFDYFI